MKLVGLVKTFNKLARSKTVKRMQIVFQFYWIT